MLDLNQITNLLETARTESTAFQSIAVTSIQILDSIHKLECIANDAALSLGQHDKVQENITELEHMQHALLGVLNKQGKQILSLQKTLDSMEKAPLTSWWTCVDNVLETLSTGIDCIGSIVKSQPKDSAARALGTLVIDVLEDQHRDYLAEIDTQLIDE